MVIRLMFMSAEFAHDLDQMSKMYLKFGWSALIDTYVLSRSNADNSILYLLEPFTMCQQ